MVIRLSRREIDIYNIRKSDFPKGTSFKKLDYFRHRINEELTQVREEERGCNRDLGDVHRAFRADVNRADAAFERHGDSKVLMKEYDKIGNESERLKPYQKKLYAVVARRRQLEASLEVIHELMDNHPG